MVEREVLAVSDGPRVLLPVGRDLRMVRDPEDGIQRTFLNNAGTACRMEKRIPEIAQRRCCMALTSER